MTNCCICDAENPKLTTASGKPLCSLCAVAIGFDMAGAPNLLRVQRREGRRSRFVRWLKGLWVDMRRFW